MDTKQNNRGRALPALLLVVMLLVGIGASRVAPVAAQDPGFGQSFTSASVATPSASTVITASTTSRYVIKSIVITDTSSETVTLLDGATGIFKIGCLANTPVVLSEAFFGPAGYVPPANNTALKMTAAAGTVSINVRYLVQ
jgi:hypothetical protein